MSEAEANLSSKVAVRAQRDEEDNVTRQAWEAEHQILKATAVAATMESSKEDDGSGGDYDSGGGDARTRRWPRQTQWRQLWQQWW